MYLQGLTGGLVVKTVCFCCRGCGFDPWGTKKVRSCMLRGVAKKKKKKKQHNYVATQAGDR